MSTPINSGENKADSSDLMTKLLELAHHEDKTKDNTYLESMVRSIFKENPFPTSEDILDKVARENLILKGLIKYCRDKYNTLIHQRITTAIKDWLENHQDIADTQRLELLELANKTHEEYDKLLKEGEGFSYQVKKVFNFKDENSIITDLTSTIERVTKFTKNNILDFIDEISQREDLSGIIQNGLKNIKTKAEQKDDGNTETMWQSWILLYVEDRKNDLNKISEFIKSNNQTERLANKIQESIKNICP